MSKIDIGIIGCGKISDIYIQNLQKNKDINILGCASLNFEETKATTSKYNIPLSLTVDEMLNNEKISAILNLTIPAAHYEISKKSLEAGKHVYSEKPLSINISQAKELLQISKEKNLLLGCAPDTFFGGRWQTVKKLINDNVIGRPTAIHAFVGTHGTERHHPNPDFYYKVGGGPMLDLGPYYLTMMVFLLGPISKVCGISNKSSNTRKIENGPRNGELIDVEVDTHCQGLLQFKSGMVGSIIMSFDVWDSETPRIEIFGEEGVISIPDPDPVFGANIFEGDVFYRKIENSRWSHQPRPKGRDDWIKAENNFSYNENYRGIGFIEMIDCIKSKRIPRANSNLAFHVLEVIESLEKSSNESLYMDILSEPHIPEILPENYMEF